MMQILHTLRPGSFVLTILILSILCVFLFHSKRQSLAAQIEVQPQVTMQLQSLEVNATAPLMAYNSLK